MKYPERAEVQRLRRIQEYATTPPTYDEQRNWLLKHRYGITTEDYRKLLENQQYLCAICKRDSRDMTYLLHVDHCHTSHNVRGLLCAPCNVYLGYSKDNPQVFEAAIQYLEKSNLEKECKSLTSPKKKTVATTSTVRSRKKKSTS